MNELWVEELRSQFPVTQRTAFFDIAYENCGADFLRETMERYFDHKADIRPGLVKAGGAGKGDAIGVIAETRQLLADFFHAPDIRNLAFTANTCQGMNLVLQGFPWQSGDNVVVGDLEHVSVLMPCLHLKERGVECRVARARGGMILTADDLLALADEHTRIIAVSYVQSCSGYKVDLAYLASECHKRGIYLVTDAIQAAGFQKIDVQALGVDALVSSCYKGLLAAEGVGFVYCTEELARQLRPVFAGDSPALTLDREHMEIRCPDPADVRKLEAGTIPFPGIYMLHTGLRRLMDIGIDRVEAHVSACFEQVYRGLEALGYSIVTPFEPEHRCHSMAVKMEHNQEAVDFFLERGVFFSCGREGCVRISVAPFTNEEDVERLLSVAQTWLEEQP